MKTLGVLVALLGLSLGALASQESHDREPAPKSEAGPGAEPIPARAVVGRGPFFAGQEIVVQVVAIAAGERPEIEPPEVPGLSLFASGTSVHPLTTSAIGDMALNETNAFLYEFRLVPERAGTVVVPPFRLTIGSRSGKTTALRLEVRPVPVIGLPASFAGGVGSLTLRAEVVPDAVRVGQSFEYRVHLEGPGPGDRPASGGRLRAARATVHPARDRRAARRDHR